MSDVAPRSGTPKPRLRAIVTVIAALLLGNACRCDPPPHVTSADNWAEADALFRQEPRWLVTEEGQRSLYWPRFLELRVAR